MNLRLLSFQSLVRMQAQTLQASTGKVWDLSVGSTIRALFEATAGVGLWMQWLIVLVQKQSRLATSSGTDADSFIRDFGMPRLPASYAAGLATFSRAGPGIASVVPVGTTVLTADRSQSFVVTGTAPYALPAGTLAVQVPVQSVAAGPGGNIQAGTLGLIAAALPGIDTVANGAGFAGGVAAESDAALRVRFPLFVDSRSRGTPSAVAFAIATYQQGLTFSIQVGNDATGAVRSGSFVVTVDDGTGTPSATLLANVYQAIDPIRPIGTSFFVVAPVRVPVGISLSISPALGYNRLNLIGPVASAVVAYVNGLPLGSALDYTRIAWAAYGVPGVDNVTAVLANGGTADLGGMPGQVVRTTLAQMNVT